MGQYSLPMLRLKPLARWVIPWGLLAGMILIIVDPFSGGAAPDQTHVYTKFLEYSQREVQNDGSGVPMPASVPALLMDAWRLQASGNFIGKIVISV